MPFKDLYALSVVKLNTIYSYFMSFSNNNNITIPLQTKNNNIIISNPCL